MEISVVYITAPDLDTARRLGSAIVQERLAACVNILSPMESIYRWEGRLEVDEEVVIIAKTTTERVDEVISRVRELHGYEIPCITSWPITTGNAAYLDWVAGECATDA